MVQNLEAWKARIAKVPKVIQDAAMAQLVANADDMVIRLQNAAPTRSDIPHSRRGTHEARKEAEDYERLRASIHAQPALNRPLTVVVIADAKDAKGDFYGPHVEYGHKTPEGGHVREHPFWWPTYRAFKSQNRRRLMSATLKAVKAHFGRP